MKKYILLFVFAASAAFAKAQAGYNYYEWGIGAEASYERGYTNVPRQDNNIGFAGKLIYNYNPYLPIELEIQAGHLSGGGLTVDKDKYGRQFSNHFIAAYLHADVHLGAIIDYGDDWFLNRIKNFYLGTGFGLVDNNNKVQRTNVIPQNGSLDYVFPGKDKSTNFAIPLRVGYEFKIYDSYDQPGWAIDVGYIHTLVFGEGLDGYDDPSSKFKNNATNQYRQFVIGFKYFFGNTVAFNKLVKNYGF